MGQGWARRLGGEGRRGDKTKGGRSVNLPPFDARAKRRFFRLSARLCLAGRRIGLPPSSAYLCEESTQSEHLYSSTVSCSCQAVGEKKFNVFLIVEKLADTVRL